MLQGPVKHECKMDDGDGPLDGSIHLIAIVNRCKSSVIQYPPGWGINKLIEQTMHVDLCSQREHQSQTSDRHRNQPGTGDFASMKNEVKCEQDHRNDPGLIYPLSDDLCYESEMMSLTQNLMRNPQGNRGEESESSNPHGPCHDGKYCDDISENVHWPRERVAAIVFKHFRGPLRAVVRGVCILPG